MKIKINIAVSVSRVIKIIVQISLVVVVDTSSQAKKAKQKFPTVFNIVFVVTRKLLQNCLLLN